MRVALRVDHKGSRLAVGYDWLGRLVLKVDGRSVWRERIYNFEPRSEPLIEGDVYCRDGLADLALYVRFQSRQRFVLQDGDTVIAASHPDELPACQQPQPML